MGLLEDLKAAEAISNQVGGCELCRVFASIEDKDTREALRVAVAGTIGMDKLTRILRQNGIVDPRTGKPIGKRALKRHREEEHSS